MVTKKEGAREKKANAPVIPAVPEAQCAHVTIGALAILVAGTAMLMFAENEQ